MRSDREKKKKNLYYDKSTIAMDIVLGGRKKERSKERRRYQDERPSDKRLYPGP